MPCCNKKSKYSLSQLTELIELSKVINYNNQFGEYSNQSIVKATLFAYIETKEPKTQIFDGMIMTDATTHKIVVRWNASLFGNISNQDRIGTGDVVVIKKSQEILEIISIYNENSANLFAIINCKSRGDAGNVQNQSIDTVI